MKPHSIQFYSRLIFFQLLTPVLLVLILLSATLHAQEKANYTIRNYTSQEYKAHVQSWATIQDNQGVLYFANGLGILKFDGASWQLIKVSNYRIISVCV
jgi:ligand-binding sensor domain-containing protein